MNYFLALLIGFVIVQRAAELVLSQRNEKWLRARGAYEVGRGHYPWIVTMHTAFFAALITEVIVLRRQPATWWWIPGGVFVLAQALRYWSIATLGRRWNTRILVLPGRRPIDNGPYRFLRHPNYLAVAVEFVTIPLMCQAYGTAVCFSLCNAVMMSIRIREEERALRLG